MKFPRHKCGLTVKHNPHKDHYQTVEKYLKDLEDCSGNLLDDDDFSSPTARQTCIDTDELWILQWYPDTPIGFLRVIGPTLEQVLNAAWSDETSGKPELPIDIKDPIVKEENPGEVHFDRYVGNGMREITKILNLIEISAKWLYRWEEDEAVRMNYRNGLEFLRMFLKERESSVFSVLGDLEEKNVQHP